MAALICGAVFMVVLGVVCLEMCLELRWELCVMYVGSCGEHCMYKCADVCRCCDGNCAKECAGHGV